MAAFNKNRRPDTFTFDEAVAWHLNNGFLHSTPSYFIMGRPVNSKAAMGEILNYGHEFEPAECDAWHVALAAGKLSDAWAIMPWPLPLMGFDRDGELRFYPTNQVKRLMA